MKYFKTIVPSIAILFFFVGPAWAQQVVGDESADETIRIGVEGAYPPFSYTTPEGKLEGFDIDIADALCDQMNVRCPLVQQAWSGIIAGLLAKKYDAIIASMTNTAKRRKKVDFTNKYYSSAPQFVAPKELDVEITQEGLKGMRIGVQRGTIHDYYLTNAWGDVVDIVRYDTQTAMALDAQTGRIDLMLADRVSLLQGFLSTDAGQGWTTVGEPVQGSQYVGKGIAIAVRPGADKLRERFNAAIKAIRESGRYQKIADKYFDFNIYGGEQVK